MEEAIRNFAKQFEWKPKIENEDKLQRTGKYIICGMGGSHLQGDVMQNAISGFDLSIHQDYGLPGWPDEVLKKTLIVASSYSGNTEETVSAFEEAIKKGYSVAVSSTGGKLIELAKEHGIPYVQIPDTGIQPRSALGFTFKALAAIVGQDDMLQQASALAIDLKPEEFEEQGKKLAETLKGRVPIIYTSNKNYSIAYNWKIKFNETGKIPAFYNLFPELNHNEMNGFDAADSTRDMTKNFHFIFLKDAQDHPRIQKRMEILEKQLKDRGLQVEVFNLEGSTSLHKIFSSLLLADWTALYMAKLYGTEPEQVPMIEEFKKLIA